MRFLFAILCFTALALTTSPAHATTWTILPDSTGDAPTIQAGIDSAQTGDTVQVTCGTYFEFDVLMKGGITLLGDSSGCAVINADDLGRVMVCDSLVGATLIKNMVFRNGVNPVGTAIPHGAGVYLRKSSPVFQNCLFDSNFTSFQTGGGMYCAEGSKPLIRDCRFAFNTAGEFGGGLACNDSSSAHVINCEFDQNFASKSGGGIYAGVSADVVVDSCSFTNNMTGTSGINGGGGFSSHGTSLPVVSNCLFLQNEAPFRGGAVFARGLSNPTFTRCTFFENVSPRGSSFNAFDSSQIVVLNCIVAQGFGKAVTGRGSIVMICSDVIGNDGGDWVDLIAGQDTLNNNLSTDPQFCDPSECDFSLAATSPCVTGPCGVIGALGVGCASPPQTVWYVTPNGSGDVPTIQAALDSANHGDTLLLADGIFTGAGNRDLDAHGRSVYVLSESNDPQQCIIDLEGSSIDPHQGFIFVSVIEWQRPVVLAGIQIRNGYALGPPTTNSGGAIHSRYNHLSLSNCIFHSNSAGSGGAVSTWIGSFSAVACSLSENRANVGSAMYIQGGSTASLDSMQFVANSYLDSLPSPFALTIEGVGGVVSHATFSGNLGGGMMIIQPDDLIIDQCTFVDNVGYDYGGAVQHFDFLSGGSAQFRNCLFQGNSAPEGGAIFSYSDYYDDVPGFNVFTIDSSTIVNNMSPSGSAIYFRTSYAYSTIENSIIAFNTGSEAIKSIVWEFGWDLSCTDIYGNPSGDWTGWIAGQTGTNGNFSLDPLFCDTAAGDFTLDAISPCLTDATCGQIGAYGEGCDVVTSIASDGNPVPERFHLSQNWPNPFNPATQISFTIPMATEVLLTIHSIGGQRVATLVDGPQVAGVFTYTWNGMDEAGRGVSSGVYFASLKAGSYSATKKMLLLR